MKLAGFLVGIAVFVAQAASAGIITYDGFMSGPAENPPNASPGIGFAEVIIDTTANTMRGHCPVLRACWGRPRLRTSTVARRCQAQELRASRPRYQASQGSLWA